MMATPIQTWGFGPSLNLTIGTDWNAPLSGSIIIAFFFEQRPNTSRSTHLIDFYSIKPVCQPELRLGVEFHGEDHSFGLEQNPPGNLLLWIPSRLIMQMPYSENPEKT